MDDLKQRMQALRAELLEAGRQFSRATRAGKTPPKQILLELQRRLDHLRQAIWDARKLCDPHLVPYRRDLSQITHKTFAERIVHLIDRRKESA